MFVYSEVLLYELIQLGLGFTGWVFIVFVSGFLRVLFSCIYAALKIFFLRKNHSVVIGVWNPVPIGFCLCYNAVDSLD